MFSVIIPLYNKEQSITNTIQSVLNQTFQDFEIVIVNDGSTDQSAKIVEQMTDKRIRLIHQENQGVSAARNTGIKEANRDWITFLDGDDLWNIKHLEKYNNAITTYPQLSWLASGYTSVYKKRYRDIVYNKNGVLYNVFDDLLNGLSIHTSTVCIRKDLYQQHTELFFRVGMNNSEDREVWYKLCLIDSQPYYIKESLSEYDVYVPDSLTRSQIHTSKEHYLSMEKRIKESSTYHNASNENKAKIEQVIKRFNKRAIKSRYVQGQLTSEHRNHLSKKQYAFYKSTEKFPQIIKKIITRVC